ncbi:MAG: hypothetical protein MUC91_10340 [Verrucomicrobia bacterium]|nr:hypothetical protein [Verrucomicrobiota bacterium]
MLLHLPIGFLVLLGALELLSLHPRWRHAALSNRFILWLSAPVAVITAGCGWLLADSGGYDERLLFLHRWTGVGVALATCLLLWVYSRGWMGRYRVLLLITLGLTVLTGHYGASLTHGSDFLFRYAPDWLLGASPASGETEEQGDEGGAPLYADVQSTFTEYCGACHGPDKSKGGLRLDTFEHVDRGGDSGAVIVPGDPRASLLMQRLWLPLEDDDHMPPEGKPQPTAGELKRIQAWISAGASG